ncbi:MBOAT, membrane-bound O-acyltransferase family-domain-containing protein [Aspergillus caelatus]|uniref:MBOAT, membrane-bound O-acyltransferase family-domain-containing protein n=2 Tax=Aspergillus subgen. Circumdati TaxID=2720871 RepID=A0A5N6ZWD1_9EURO|nr:MBOAT, membrane-bound O-acyltransferase family-domain-containing protein [Aspergillus caelatus]KAE8361573.1 MBOAT, membrane-bound O-acyltransferase family-domain-containing protein [Aspergillus caelatus]KAE8412610.1 MBOAT, membrane-bound O-acyltransferase family-domain-containing protein [Aspergillus pseudocaelatus]
MLPYVDLLFEYPANLTGASVDELKLIASFLLSYPLAALLKRIPDGQPWKKNAFIIAVSLFYLVGLFDLWDGLRTLAYSAAGIYAIAYYIDGSLMPWIGFIFLMGHMSISHIYRQIIDDAHVTDITGAQMVLVMKLSSFCWNVHDGRLSQEQLSDPQKYAAIKDFPSILDYLGYVLFFPSLFAGPSFEYVDYRRWIDTTLFDVPPGTDPSKVPPTRKKRKIPRSGTPAAKKALAGLGWILAFLQLGSLYNQELVLDEAFLQYSLLRRVWILHMLGFTARLKYYGVWYLTEGACVLSGMGYNGFDPKSGKVFWNRLENVDPWTLETAQNSHGYLGSWNKNTNHWLRNYVYLRVTPKGKKPGFRASLATFVTSAFWHGFYPGYYLTFVLGSFIQTVAKNFRRHVRPFFLTPDGSRPTAYKKYYDIASYVVTQLTLSFAVMPFIFLSFGDSIKVWRSVYFYGIVGNIASLAFFVSPAKGLLLKKLKARNKPHVPRALSSENVRQPTLGLPNDAIQEFDDAVQEIRAEIESRQRRGSLANMPTGDELKAAVEDKIGRRH